MSDFMFIYPAFLWLLIPCALLLCWLKSKRRGHQLIAPHLAKALGLSVKISHRLLYVIGLSWLIAIVALAGPSFVKAPSLSAMSEQSQVLVLDMSDSMYATDIKPTRLQQSIYKARDLLSRFKEGYTGLVAYAGDGYVISPMTQDTHTIASLLGNLSPDIMPFQGSAPALGVKQAIEMLKGSGVNDGTVILFTDALSDGDKKAIASMLQHTSWRLVVYGIGTANGAPVLLANGQMIKDKQGAPVIAKTDLGVMAQLAREVNGLFVPYQVNNQDIDQIYHFAYQNLPRFSDKDKQHEENITAPLNQGYWLVLLLLFPALALFRRGLLFTCLPLMVTVGFPLSLTLALAPTPVSASAFLTQDQQGMRAFESKDYQRAASEFKNRQWQGMAHYRAGDYQAAITALSDPATPDEEYNLANAYAQARDFDKAIDGYKKVLQSEPDHQAAAKNLAIVEAEKLKRQKEQQAQNNQQENQQENQTQKDKKEQSSQGQQGESSSHSKSKPEASTENKTSPNNSKEQGPRQEQESLEPSSNEGSASKGASEKGSSSGQSADDKSASSPREKHNSQGQSSSPPSTGDEQKGQSSGFEKEQTDKHTQQSSSLDKSTDESRAKQSDGEERQANASRHLEQSSEQSQAEQGPKMASGSSVQQQRVDPELRKLEQVEMARDPSQLLRAQLLLQAQQRQQSNQ